MSKDSIPEESGALELRTVLGILKDHGVRNVYAKWLSPNDNSKNQPYFGGDFGVLNILPASPPVAEMGGKRPNFKARLRFGWLLDNGEVSPAPGAQLILYPDYPEVRFSGYLAGARKAPSKVMGTTRAPGRLLILGVTDDGRVIGYAVGPDAPAARQLATLDHLEQTGVFLHVPLELERGAQDSRANLLEELCRIHNLGWIASQRLKSGSLVPCNAPQCGGYTLEAQLGISPNGIAEPDFHGWEVKAHRVSNFRSRTAGALTLMTPEPRGGIYVSEGVVAFLDRYGYSSPKAGRENRRDFSGRHFSDRACATTGLTLRVLGYDHCKNEITDTAGSVALVDGSDAIAASWPFTELMTHWMRKHANTVYVPCTKRTSQLTEYMYGGVVRLGIGTEFIRFINAIAHGALYYDPGIHYERVGQKIVTKRRSQFRIASKSLAVLYSQLDDVAVCGSDNTPR